MTLSAPLVQFLASVHPYDSLERPALEALAAQCVETAYSGGQTVFSTGDVVDSLFIVVSGEIEITDEADVQLSLLGPRNSFGERALLREDVASRTATARSDATLIVMPADALFGLIKSSAKVARFFDRRRPARTDRKDLTTLRVADLMTRDPLTCAPETTI